MDWNNIVSFGIQFGPVGLIVFYLIQRESAERKERIKEAEIRAEIAKEDIASKERLASALTALCIAITGRPYA